MMVTASCRNSRNYLLNSIFLYIKFNLLFKYLLIKYDDAKYS